MTADVVCRLAFHRDRFPSRWNASLSELIRNALPDYWTAAWGTAWNTVSQPTIHQLNSAWEVHRAGNSPALRDAIVALHAWPEDSALMLDMPVDAVRLLAASGHHPAVLMLPACIALNGERDEAIGPPT